MANLLPKRVCHTHGTN